MSNLATPEGFVPEILEEILGFVRSPSGDTLTAELDGISFLAGEVPALLAAGADYVAWKAARARMSERSLRLCVDSRSLRIVCRKLCGEWFSGQRSGEITLSAAVDRLIVTYRGQSVRISAAGTWIGSVSLNANAFCCLVERRRRRPYPVISFEDGRLSVDGHREPGRWIDDEVGD